MAPAHGMIFQGGRGPLSSHFGSAHETSKSLEVLPPDGSLHFIEWFKDKTEAY